MGGRGSGNRNNHPSRATCESLNVIDIRYLQRRGALVPGGVGRINWSVEDHVIGDVNYRVHETTLELSYRWQAGSADNWHEVVEHIPLEFTAQHLGGKRPWFTCLGCCRRSACLYAGSYFRCRKCQNLAYRSQSLAAASRALSTAQKVRTRLGGSGSLSDAFPSKPRGMHQRTYDRFCDKSWIVERRLLSLR